MWSASLALLAGAVAVANAAVSPLTPSTAAEGSQQTITWTADPTRTWTSMSIWLRSGSNQQMTDVAEVATGVNGVTTTSISYTIPQLNATGPIYFYEFTYPSRNNPQWTTRFAVTTAGGQQDAAQFATQPSGEAIPWGVGALTGGSTPAVISSAVPIVANATSTATGRAASSAAAAALASSLSANAAAASASASGALSTPTSTSIVVVTASAASGSSTPSSFSSVTSRVGAASTTLAGTGHAAALFIGAALVAALA